jgi:hypothetical protein
MHFWFNGSFFSGDDWNILEEEVKTDQMAQSSPLHLTTFLSAHL